MPGTYTHITHASLLTEQNRLDDLKLPENAKKALMYNPEYCRLGSISPDYPYLRVIGDKIDAKHWGNAMHHKYGTLTEKNILHVGTDYLRKLDDGEKGKCFSWFIGYASHIVADVTCHPVTNLLVGDYDAGNEIAHRRSEMHQDVYIYEKKLDGDVRNSEEIQNVIGTCTETDNKFDSQIDKFWRFLLSESFPGLTSRGFTIDIQGWHDAVQLFVDDFAEELSIIPSRHISRFLDERVAIAYPRPERVDKQKYINQLMTPNGLQNYVDIFDYTNRKIGEVWQILAKAVYDGDEMYKERIGVWDLDTGQEVFTQKIMWGA